MTALAGRRWISRVGLDETELLEKLMKELVSVSWSSRSGRSVGRSIATSGSRCIIGKCCQSEPQCKHSTLSTQHSVTVLDRSEHQSEEKF